MKLVLQRKSRGPVGDIIWWYDGGRCVVKVPASYSDSGKAEYRAEWRPHNGIMFHRYQPAVSLADARAWLRHGYLPGRVATTATGRTFTVPPEGV